MEPDPEDEVEVHDSPIPAGEHLADMGMEMERQKLLEEKKRLEANLAQVLWEDGHEPSEDDQLSWKMRLRGRVCGPYAMCHVLDEAEL